MVIKEIQNRRSVRKYQEKEVPDELIKEVIRAGQFAPTARNNRAVEFVVVRDPKTKDEIFNVVGQEFVKEAPVLIISVSDTSKLEAPLEIAVKLSSYDLAVASENMFLQGASLGLGTVWKNLREEEDHPRKVKEILGIPEHFTAINIIPLGYPEEEPEPHKDEEFDQGKIHWESF